MIVADTSVWIEFLKGRYSVAKQFETLLNQRQIVAVECIFGELLQGVYSSDEAAIICSYWLNLPRNPENGIWIAAGEISWQKKYHSKGVGLIDLVILVFAEKFNYRVWTLDKKLKGILPANLVFG